MHVEWSQAGPKSQNLITGQLCLDGFCWHQLWLQCAVNYRSRRTITKSKEFEFEWCHYLKTEMKYSILRSHDGKTECCFHQKSKAFLNIWQNRSYLPLDQLLDARSFSIFFVKPAIIFLSHNTPFGFFAQNMIKIYFQSYVIIIPPYAR